MAEHTPHAEHVLIEVWADLGCPWCYISKHRLQTAIDQRPDAERFDIEIRSFQLYPDMSGEPQTNEQAFLQTHPGSTTADVRQAERQMQFLARNEGLEYSSDRMIANTRDVHRVVQYAKEEGRGFEFFASAQDAFFAGALNPYAPGALEGVAEAVGLSGSRVHEILASDEYADRVRADRDEAVELGANGVPFAVFDRRLAAPGVLKVTGYSQLLEQVAGAVPTERAG